MDTVVYVISILMWILCPAIIGLILLQGAAGDISSAFGGGGQLDASLGVGAHRKMAQVTGALAVLFFIMVLFMAYPHRGSFQNVKNAPAPATTPSEQAKPGPAPAPAVPAKPEAAKPTEAAPAPVVLPEAAKPAEAAPAPAPVQVQAQPQAQAQPEAAKPVETAPAPEAAKPEAKPVEPLPATVPTLAPAPAPAEPAKP